MDDKLTQIHNLVSDHIASGRDMLLSTWRLLNEILELSKPEELIEDVEVTEAIKKENKEEEQVMEEIIISCDASIKKNPGGPSSVGVVIRWPEAEERKPVLLSKITPAISNNEAEYDAVYEGILFLMNTQNRPNYPVCIRSDSQLVVKQLSGEYEIKKESLKKRFKAIHELCANLPIPVRIEWLPRNSTPDLTSANFAAQDLLSVKRH